MKPRLSVLIDTYNHERYIEQALVSAIEQDFPAREFEILVVDDGSTDRTPDIIRKFAPRVRLLRKSNGGQASAFNAGASEIRGDIVAFLDGDDWFARQKLSLTVAELDRNSDLAAVGHGYYEWRQETGESEIRVPQRRQFLQASTPQRAIEAFNSWPYLLMGALTMRTSLLRQIVPIPEELLFCADTPISMACMAKGVHLIDQPLFYYRHHATNLHAVGAEDTARRLRRLDMNALAFGATLPVLLRIGVEKPTAEALVLPTLIGMSRQRLATYGGSRLRTFQTEMRSFRYEHRNPKLRYRLFKYLVVGGATLLIPPRAFYKGREWYGRKRVGTLREHLVAAETARGPRPT